MRLSHVPDSITVNGTTLYVVIGKNHGQEITKAKANKLKYRTVSVFNKALTGKENLHGKPYADTVWLYVERGPTTTAHEVKRAAVSQSLDRAGQEEYMKANGIAYGNSELTDENGEVIAHLFTFIDNSVLKVLWEVLEGANTEQFQVFYRYSEIC